jgi:hypothetical protein
MPVGEKNYSPNRRSRKKIYDFPAEDWKHLRTTNPIESVIATVRLRPQAHQRKRLAHRLLGDGPPTDALRRQEMAAA